MRTDKMTNLPSEGRHGSAAICRKAFESSPQNATLTARGLELPLIRAETLPAINGIAFARSTPTVRRM